MLGKMLGGRYRIIKHLGAGAFGVTFVAEDMQRPGNPQCVVKQFQPKNTDPQTLREARRLFDNEAKMLEKLGNHDQIPRLLAHLEENEEFYLVQEFIEGHDLSQEVLLRQKLSETVVIKLLQDILEVLAFVHQHKIIHRDIKPSNIRRRKDGKIVLIDFGAVKQISTQIVNAQGQTSFTIAIGTVGYMPSEQGSCNPQLSSDVYAVGMVGIQALTGIYPTYLQKDSQTGEIIWRHQAQVSQELADILDKMVRYDFRQRYHSATDALQTLNELSTLHNQTTVTEKQQKRSPGKLMIGLAIAAILAIITAYLYFDPFKPPLPPENLLPYEDPKSRIKIKYPQSWEKIDIGNVVTEEVVVFVSPKQSDTDKFQEKLTISVEDFSGTLQDFSDRSTNHITRHLVKAEIQKPRETILANKSAHQLIYTGQDGENKVKNMRLFTLRGDKAYIVTYTAAIDNYNDFIQTAETMIKSFEIQ
ncbi:protein kinase [Scytonema hofmannii FACHB-248]|uniref:non-specific serine/threonine protein kinase n=2 Tax=Cyanophyceae TaxID=3028117 RepID=A0ABR8GVN5_9CYAN|nr:protein kinase [Scytonema hofmannii FACHB-248]